MPENRSEHHSGTGRQVVSGRLRLRLDERAAWGDFCSLTFRNNSAESGCTATDATARSPIGW